MLRLLLLARSPQSTVSYAQQVIDVTLRTEERNNGFRDRQPITNGNLRLWYCEIHKLFIPSIAAAFLPRRSVIMDQLAEGVQCHLLFLRHRNPSYYNGSVSAPEVSIPRADSKASKSISRS